MGNLFYNVLGGITGSSITTIHNTNYNLFSNVLPSRYWTATEYAPDTSSAWSFLMYGDQSVTYKPFNLYAWAVHSGDVGAEHSGDVNAVPEPATVWLIGGGLIGLIGAARRKTRI